MSHKVQIGIEIQESELDTLKEVMTELGYPVDESTKTLSSYSSRDNEEVDLVFKNHESSYWTRLNIGAKIKDGKVNLVGDNMILTQELKGKIEASYIKKTATKILGMKGYAITDEPDFGRMTATRTKDGKMQSIDIDYGKMKSISTHGFTGNQCCQETAELERALGVTSKREFKSEFFTARTEKQQVRCNKHDGLCG